MPTTVLVPGRLSARAPLIVPSERNQLWAPASSRSGDYIGHLAMEAPAGAMPTPAPLQPPAVVAAPPLTPGQYIAIALGIAAVAALVVK